MMSSHHRAKSRRSPLPRRSRNASTSSPGRNASATGGEQIRSQWDDGSDARAPFLGASLPPITPSPDAPVQPAQSNGHGNSNGHGHAAHGSDSSHPSYPPPVHVGPPSGTPASSGNSTPQQHSTRLQFSPLPIAAASLLSQSQSPFTPLRSHSSASPAPAAAAAGSMSPFVIDKAASVSPFAGMSFKTSPVTPAQQNQVAAERLDFLRRSTPLAILPTNAVGSASNSRTGSRSGTRPPTPLHSPRRGGALSISSLSLGGSAGLHSSSNMGSPNSAHSFGQGNRSANASTSPVPHKQHHHSASASFAYPLVSAPPAPAALPERRPLPPPDLPPSTQPVQPAPPAPTPVTPPVPLPAEQPAAVAAVAPTSSASDPPPISEPAAAAAAPEALPSSSPLTTALAMLSSSTPALSPPPLLTDQLVLTSIDGAATEAPVPVHPSEIAALTLDSTNAASRPIVVAAALAASSPPVTDVAVTLAPPAAPAPAGDPAPVAPVAAHDRIADLLEVEPDAPVLSLSPMDRELQLMAAGEKDVPRVVSLSSSSSSSAPLPVDADVDAIRALNEASDRSLSFKAAESSDASPPLTLEVPRSYLVVGGVVVAVGVAVWWWRAELEERVRRLLRR